MTTIRQLELRDLTPNALESFVRMQKTTSVRRQSESGFTWEQDNFVDNWNDQDKARVIGKLKQCLETGGAVVGAFETDRLVGFANLENRRLGSNEQYANMPYLHVSADLRGAGIGRELFNALVTIAREREVPKVYIGAHPAESTQRFYDAMGCVAATEIVEEIFSKQPLDIQLEFVVN